MKPLIAIFAGILLLVPLHWILGKQMAERPGEERLGYLPAKEIIRIAALDYRTVVSEWLFIKVIAYYGSVIDQGRQAESRPIEYLDMYGFLNASTFVDPYNLDPYYLAQAIFTWELGRIKEVNYLLERGMAHRTWDPSFPFYIGFNYFYFLKDFPSAANYMKRAAELTGDPLFANLAARFLYESDETRTAISFIKAFRERTWNPRVRQVLDTRLRALEAVSELQQAAEEFQKRYNRQVHDIRELTVSGIIERVPQDPYGGQFYIDGGGKVRSTSKFAFGKKDGNTNQNTGTH